MSMVEIGQKVPFGESLIFVDTETANPRHDICQVAAVVCQNGIVIDVFDCLVKPKGNFENQKYSKHKITPDMVQNSPNFSHIWDLHFEQYKNFIFVGHNFAGSDACALNYSLTIPTDSKIKINYIDTMRLAEILLNRDKAIGLESLCVEFNFPIVNAHNALDDAIGCFQLYTHFVQKFNFTAQDFISNCFLTGADNFKKDSQASIDYSKKFAHKDYDMKEIVATTVVNDELDADFAGKIIVFTGDLRKFPDRADAIKTVMARGAKNCTGSLSGKTDMLICGTTGVGPQKMEKAKLLEEQGTLRIVDELTFYRMLEDNNAVD